MRIPKNTWKRISVERKYEREYIREDNVYTDGDDKQNLTGRTPVSLNYRNHKDIE